MESRGKDCSGWAGVRALLEKHHDFEEKLIGCA